MVYETVQGKWKMKMENGNGKWKMENGKWKMKMSGEYLELFYFQDLLHFVVSKLRYISLFIYVMSRRFIKIENPATKNCMRMLNNVKE